jgi:zinc transport system ATP-binding protein
MPQLSCVNLTLGYEGETVVSGLTFEVNAGDYLCIVGENGSGKTTLMKAILKLISPVSGKILTGDGLGPGEIGYLPQQTAAQRDFPASVREIVRSGCLNQRGLRPFYNKAEKQSAEENMIKLGITDLSKRCFRELSGGQQQKTLLARALCAARKILLMDEPAAGLDPKASAELYALTERLNAAGVTIIMITHDIAAAVKYSTHILHIGAHTPEFFGTRVDYIKSGAGRIYAGAACGGTGGAENGRYIL